MKPATSLPLTAEHSRSARFQLGLTQRNVVEESGLPGHKLKPFETGRFVPDLPFLQKLREFYEGKGATIGVGPPDPAAASIASRPGAVVVAPAFTSRFLVDPSLTQDQADAILERMDANDEAIIGLMSQEATSFLGDLDADTDAAVRQVFGLFGENYLLFGVLQGRVLLPGKAGDRNMRTVSDVVQGVYADSPVSGLISDANQPSPGGDTPKAPAAPESAEAPQ